MPDSPTAPARGDQRSASRRDVLKYVLSAPVLAGLGAAVANLDAGRASAAGVKLIDFADRLVSPNLIAAAGYAGAVVYVAPSRPGANFDFKPVTRAYADALRADGLQVVSNYQYGKPGWPTPSDYTRGYAGGVADAHTALELHAAAGGGDGAPVFFSLDENIDCDTWGAIAVEWFRGINSVIGLDRTGIYGSSMACAWAIGDDVIGHSSTSGYRWAWQTRAWSAGEREPAAVLYQSTIVTATDPGVLLGGIHVDEDDVLAADFGQWDLAR
ncbi:MAG: glycoside hydrolase domain-containing protein [Mycobacterium sp.]